MNTPENKPNEWNGRAITVVYRITDAATWSKTNPLHYDHNGLESYCAAVGDSEARLDQFREALTRIAEEGDFDAREIAQAALDAEQEGRGK